MTPAEAAARILAAYGERTVSQAGCDGLTDLLWDACPEYQSIPLYRRPRFRDAVAEEVFG